MYIVDEFGEDLCFEVAGLLLVAKSDGSERAMSLCVHQLSIHGHDQCDEPCTHVSHGMHDPRVCTVSLHVAEYRSQPLSGVYPVCPMRLALGDFRMNVQATSVDMRCLLGELATTVELGCA